MQDLVRGFRDQVNLSLDDQLLHCGQLRSRCPSSEPLDSGAESGDEELCLVNDRPENRFASHSPPTLISSPPMSEQNEDSWDSIGHESGILTSDTLTDSEASNDTTIRRTSPKRSITKAECEFPLMSMTDIMETDAAGSVSNRSQSIPRRIRVRVLVNRAENGMDLDEPPCKRIMLERPALDFDKMLSTRMDDSLGIW